MDALHPMAAATPRELALWAGSVSVLATLFVATTFPGFLTATALSTTALWWRTR